MVEPRHQHSRKTPIGPSTALPLALDKLEANEDLAQLPGITRVLVMSMVLPPSRIVAALTQCPRRGEAAVVAVNKWARSIGKLSPVSILRPQD
jgi:hypothetical protein